MGSEQSTDAEIFLPIPGYEGYYEVSDWGRVRSLINSQQNPRKEPKYLAVSDSMAHPFSLKRK